MKQETYVCRRVDVLVVCSEQECYCGWSGLTGIGFVLDTVVTYLYIIYLVIMTVLVR